MSKNNSEYWTKRTTNNLKKGLADVRKVDKEFKKAYQRAGEEIEKNIATLYMRYAKDNELEYSDAKKYLTKSEFKKWRMGLVDYIEEIERLGDPALLLELNTLAMKSRISRLEEMLYQVNLEIDKATLMQHQKVSELLDNTYKANYYKSIFDIQQFKGIGTSFAFIDKKTVKDILAYPWSGMDYSSRIWRNRTKLKEVVKEELTQMIIQGKGNKDVAKRLADRMNSTYSNAMRLVNTEHAFVMGESTAKSYIETDIKKYEILSTLDVITSEICRKQDGKIYLVENKKVGVNYPPFHPRCRTDTIPVIEDGDMSDEKRTARNKGGKTYEVPASMKYDEWYGKYVEGR